MLFGLGAMAQNAVSPSDLNGQPLTSKQQAILSNAKARIHAANKKAGVAGGAVSQYMSHADLAEQLFGSLLTNYISPIFQDSTVYQDFGALEYVDNHGYGAVFDVTSEAYVVGGLDYFADVDPYHLDSVFIGGFYDRVNNKSTTHVGDTLIVDIVYGNPSGGMFRQLTWPAGIWTNQTADYDFSAVAFSGNAAQGYAGDVTWANKVTFKKSMTPADTAIGYHAFYTNLNINAGEILGIAVRFKSGESYNTGDVYFAGSGSSSTADINSFRVLITGPAGASDGNAYFFEEISMGVPESYAGAGPLFSSSRYGTVANGYFLNQGGSTTDWWIYVSGQSSVSLDEEKANTQVNLYPNPTKGNVTLEIAQGGTYRIDVLNVVGQVVYSEEVNVNGGEKLNRDFSNLNKGIYLVNMTTNGVTNTTKLTIE